MDGHSGYSNELVPVEGVDPKGGVALSFLKHGPQRGGTFILHVRQPQTITISGIRPTVIYHMIGFREYPACNVLDDKPACFWIDLGTVGEEDDDPTIARAHKATQWAAENLRPAVEELKEAVEKIWGILPGAFPGLGG